ncbi:Protein of unknown function [Cotesia congregata]|uniref:Uncharacterized protein n=1 Tax=Cotesia congregata TaxID=51543 RepID=A0A8J2HKN0_COTCN|nr:Protein of unknown function [Cotesia congregata]
MRFCHYCILYLWNQAVALAPYVITAVSFRDQVSDIENNKAVAGLKFVKKDGMIHIQIVESEVLPHGQFENEVWKPLEEFTYK